MTNFYFPTTINSLDSYAEFRDNVKNKSEKNKKKHYDVFEWIYIRCRLSEAQNHRCCWCQKLATAKRGRKNSATVEHYICRSAGGTDEIDNLVMACSGCNNKRGSHLPEVFLNYIQNSVPLPSVKCPKRTAEKRLKDEKRTMLFKLRNDPQVVWC